MFRSLHRIAVGCAGLAITVALAPTAHADVKITAGGAGSFAAVGRGCPTTLTMAVTNAPDLLPLKITFMEDYRELDTAWTDAQGRATIHWTPSISGAHLLSAAYYLGGYKGPHQVRADVNVLVSEALSSGSACTPIGF